MKKTIVWTFVGVLFCVYVGYAFSQTLADIYIQANKPLVSSTELASTPAATPEATETVSHNNITPTPEAIETESPEAVLPALPACESTDVPGIRHIVLDEGARSLHLPETDSLEVNEQVRNIVFTRAAEHTDGLFFASRYSLYRYNDQLVGFAFTFTACDADSSLTETKVLMTYDLLGGRAVAPDELFAPAFDFAAATAAVLDAVHTVDFTSLVFDTAQAVFLSNNEDGTCDEVMVPLSAYGDNWQADAYLLRYYGHEESSPSDEPAAPSGEGKYLAITFDDGPESTHTARLLDGLAEHDAKATFFVLGHRLGKTADLIERMVNEGHSVGSHTYSHVNLTAVAKETIAYQLDETNMLLKNITGQEVLLLRPPYGNRNAQVAEMAAERGMSLILWSVDPQDWKMRDARQTADHIIARAKDGEIILLHDIYASSVDGALLAVKELTAQGYTFVTVDELLDMNGGRVTGGIYRTGKGTVSK